MIEPLLPPSSHHISPAFVLGVRRILHQPARKMRSQLVFVGFMLFVSVAYYLMAYGQPTSNTVLHGMELPSQSGPSQSLEAVSGALTTINVTTTNVTATITTTAAATSKNVTNTKNVTVANLTVQSTNSTSSDSVNSLDTWANLTLSNASTYLINHPSLCRTNAGDPAIRVAILVVTAPQNSEQRQAIRSTWGTVARTQAGFRLAFILGRPVKAGQQAALVAENAAHGDLLQGNFLDAYYNLTLKTLMLLRWSRKFCPQAEYVLKIDDDCFLHPANLLAFLAAPRKEKNERVIFGRVWQKVKPIRDKKHKWAVSKEQFAGDEFPDYVGGPTYAISRQAVPALLDASASVPMLDLEDVYLTGLCAERAKVARVSNVQFGVADSPAVCAAREVITYHRVPASSLYMLWWFIHDTRFETCSAKKNDCATEKNWMIFDLLNTVTKHLPTP